MTRPHWLRVGARAPHVAGIMPKGAACVVVGVPYGDTIAYVVFDRNDTLIEIVHIASLRPAEWFTQAAEDARHVKPPKARRRRGG